MRGRAPRAWRELGRARLGQFLILALGVVGVGGFSRDAHAQQPAPPGYAPPLPYAPAPGLVRDGFAIGVGAGVGSMSCDGCDSGSGVAVVFHLGFAVNPRLQLLIDGSSVEHRKATVLGSFSQSHSVVALALNYFVMPNLWLRGGLGTGYMTLRDDDRYVLDRSEDGSAVLFAVGYEVYQSGSLAVDLQVRGAAVNYDDNTVTNSSVLVGINWY